MPQTGILSPTGNLNVLVAQVFDQNGHVAATFVFSMQHTRVEVEVQAVKLYMTTLEGTLHGKDASPSHVTIMEHEVVAKEPAPRSADHGNFVKEIHGAIAAFRQSITNRFGHDNGEWWAIFNGPVSIAQNDLIERSRFIP